LLAPSLSLGREPWREPQVGGSAERKLQRFKSCWMTLNTLSVAVTKPTLFIALISDPTQSAASI
jgi:hypothetical protein